MNEFPLVSCLCVTRNKTYMINRAIKCFEAQTYPSKELIILYEANDIEIRNFLRGITNENIKIHEIGAVPKLTLGALRNLSIELSSGEYICQWDADDWYHKDRIEIQMSFIKKTFKPVCFLTYWILFDEMTGKSYLSRKRLWEGSILAKKEIFSNGMRYPELPKLEDFRLVEKILKQNIIIPIDVPYLYVYVYHGENTWDYDHFKGNFSVGQSLDYKANLLIKKVLHGIETNTDPSSVIESADVIKQFHYGYEFY